MQQSHPERWKVHPDRIVHDNPQDDEQHSPRVWLPNIMDRTPTTA